MLVPLVLPFKIAALIVLVVGSVIVVVFWRRGNRLHEVLALTAFIGLATMLPLTLAVNSILDPMRYRIFQFATAAQITDPYVQVPPTAVNITYDRQSTGHFARFTVPEPQLENWLQEQCDRGMPFDDASNNDGELLKKEIFQDYFGKYGWKYQPDFKEFSGWRAADGAGFTIWHSATTDTAVLRAGYW